MAAALCARGIGVKRFAFMLGAATALIVLAGAWFVTNFERVEVRVPVGPSAAARDNPYLAAMRFAERLGWQASLEAQPTRLPPASGHAAVILPAGRTWLTPLRAQALLRWVENGAHLIVQPEPVRQRDALLDALGIARRSAPPEPIGSEVQLPGKGAPPLRLEGMVAQVLDLRGTKAEVLIADTHGVRLASLRRGAGRVTAIAALQRFDNRNIGRSDHAELLRRVLAMTPGERLLVVQAAAPPALWGWLAEHAAGVIGAAVLVLLLALWRILPRFGPVLPTPEADRRALLEHLRAAGRLRWAQGARGALLVGARAHLERHLALAAPRLGLLPLEARCIELSAQLGTDAQTVEHALCGEARSARDVVQIVSTLASIHAGLRGARRHAPAQRTRR